MCVRRVKHLNGCKTCTFMILVAGGCGECHSSAANEDSYDIFNIDPRRWTDVPASIFMSNFCDGQWLIQEPPRHFSTNISQRFQTLFSFLHSWPIYFRISEINLPLGYGNLPGAMATPTIYLASFWNSKGKGLLPTPISSLIKIYMMECVLHVRFIPHHNSIRQFWASVL